MLQLKGSLQRIHNHKEKVKVCETVCFLLFRWGIIPAFPRLQPDKTCHRHYVSVISGKTPMGCHDHSSHVHHLVSDDLKAAQTLWEIYPENKKDWLHLDLRANSLSWSVLMRFHVVPLCHLHVEIIRLELLYKNALYNKLYQAHDTLRNWSALE